MILINPMAYLFFMLLALAVVIAAWHLAEYQAKHDRSETEYNKLYAEIQRDINNPNLDKSPANYDDINNKLIRLSKMAFKDKERTSVLRTEFRRRYSREWLKRNIESLNKRETEQVYGYELKEFVK